MSPRRISPANTLHPMQCPWRRLLLRPVDDHRRTGAQARPADGHRAGDHHASCSSPPTPSTQSSSCRIGCRREPGQPAVLRGGRPAGPADRDPGPTAARYRRADRRGRHRDRRCRRAAWAACPLTIAPPWPRRSRFTNVGPRRACDRLDGAVRVVGFVGRRNPAADTTDTTDTKADQRAPKYLNTGQTPLYRKGAHLFGLTEDTGTLDRGGLAVLVEGPLDALAVEHATAGAMAGVAPLGTTLTTTQAGQLGAV